MPTITAQEVEAALSRYLDPDLGCDLLTAKVVKKLSLEGELIRLLVVLGFPINSIREAWQAKLEAYLQAAFPAKKLSSRSLFKLQLTSVPVP